MSNGLSLKHLPDNLNIERDVYIAIADFCIVGCDSRKYSAINWVILIKRDFWGTQISANVDNTQI